MLENTLKKKIVVLIRRNPCIDGEVDELHIEKSLKEYKVNHKNPQTVQGNDLAGELVAARTRSPVASVLEGMLKARPLHARSALAEKAAGE